MRIRIQPLAPHEFVRPNEGRVAAGVCAGLADALGLDANVVRCGFAVATIGGGLGVLLYLVAWAAMPNAPGNVARRESRPADFTATVAFGAVVLGCLLAARAAGVWPGDVVVWPLSAALLGLALLAVRTAPGSAADLPDWAILHRLPSDAADALGVLLGTRRGALARLIAGIACVIAGIVAFVLTVDSWRALRGAFVGVVAVLAGVALVIGPALSRLAHALVQERGERIRADERAEVAAHLHDSVLQTLALVQRRADDPREVVRLARMQERELRNWLLVGDDGPRHRADESLGLALEEMMAAVEVERGVPVEVVRVRDCPLDGMEPLVQAAREAVVNAALHSGARSIAVYLEVDADQATVFVRDRGQGFDPDTVAADRGGIRNSIVGRMTRAGGRATVRSERGEGTEVELVLPRPRTNGAT